MHHHRGDPKHAKVVCQLAGSASLPDFTLRLIQSRESMSLLKTSVAALALTAADDLSSGFRLRLPTFTFPVSLCE